MSTRLWLGLSALVIIFASVAHGAGFAIGEHGAAATGMVGAFTAKADDPSAIFYNPAGLAQQHGLQLYVGGILIVGRPSVDGTASFPLPRTQTADLNVSGIPTIYLSYGLPHDFAIGIGAFTQFGLKVDWPADFSGRFVGRYASLQTVTFNPTIAWRPARWLSIGGGLTLTTASVDLQRSVNLINTEATARFRDNDLGVGGNVGVLFEGPILTGRAQPLLSIGLTYRSGFDLDFDDGAVTIDAPLELSGILHDARGSTTLKLPDLVSVGVGVRPIDRLFLQLQFDWVHWSRFQTITLTVPSAPALNVTLPQEWNNGYTLRGGAEFTAGRFRPRLGVGYDWTPIPSRTLTPIIPDSDRVLVSGGLSVDLPARLVLEGAVMGVIFLSRNSTLPAFPVRYSNWGVLSALAISYRGDRECGCRECRCQPKGTAERPPIENVPPPPPKSAPPPAPPPDETTPPPPPTY
jgi:long-chain fatty acid transport protein